MISTVSLLCGLCVALLFMSVSSSTIIKRSECGRNEFKCDSGQCIDNVLACDGSEHCQDGSDETGNLCSSIHCPGRNFRCNYGACIESFKHCNGVSNCADNSDELNCSKININDDTINCRSSEFRCNDGECISNSLVCDGTAQCRDLSDETSKECQIIVCNQFSAACDYGACIPKLKECDGIIDCIDGSDESRSWCPNVNSNSIDKLPPTKPSPTQQPDVEGCRTEILNGKLLQAGCNEDESDCSLPSILANNEGAKLSCNQGYMKSIDTEFLFCLSNDWIPNVNCIKSCHGLSSETVMLTCTYKGEKQNCSASVPVGTSFNINCNPLYEPIDSAAANFFNSQCTPSGWDPAPYQCKAICGEKGKGVKIFPWHATIYTFEEGRPSPLCTGTIVHPKFIITAAHCVSESRILKVSVGNSIIDYNGDNPNRQTLDIVDVMIPEKFKDTSQAGSGEYDLALLKLHRVIKLTYFARPVCLPSSPSVTLPKKVYMSGWSNGNLLKFKFETMDTTACIQKVNKAEKHFITIDKYCTKFEDDGTGKPNLTAYLGAGQFYKTGKTGYVLFGIASIVYSNDNIFSTSTNILQHLWWIKPKLKYD